VREENHVWARDGRRRVAEKRFRVAVRRRGRVRNEGGCTMHKGGGRGENKTNGFKFWFPGVGRGWDGGGGGVGGGGGGEKEFIRNEIP
jgi:hypothetical protein